MADHVAVHSEDESYEEGEAFTSEDEEYEEGEEFTDGEIEEGTVAAL